jgi:hypothetical protein
MSWKSKQSWSIVAGKGSTVYLELERETDGRRAPKLALPDPVLDPMPKAANAVHRLRQRTWFSERKRNPDDGKSEAPSQTSADFVRTYSAAVDALTATILNAEAGLNWLGAQPPDLEEVRRTLNTIAKEGKRAGELVVRLLAPIRDDALDP